MFIQDKLEGLFNTLSSGALHLIPRVFQQEVQNVVEKARIFRHPEMIAEQERDMGPSDRLLEVRRPGAANPLVHESARAQYRTVPGGVAHAAP